MTKNDITAEKQTIVAQLKKLKSALRKEHPNLQQRIEQLIHKVENLKFHISVLGEFSTGKSSFINAILGEEILPTALEECTATITKISCSMTKDNECSVHFDDGTVKSVSLSSLETQLTFVNEDANNITEVAIKLGQIASPVLANDVVLVDTPGVNDKDKTGDAITNQWLPQSDAVIFLTHCEQSFKESEMQFLLEKVSAVDVSKFIFVIHAADLIDSDKDRRSLTERFKSLLGDKFPHQQAIFVSSHDALDGIEESDNDLYERSGIPHVQREIVNMIIQGSGQNQLNQVKEQFQILKQDAIRYLSETVRALEVEDSLRQKMIDRKNRSILWAQNEHQRLHQELKQQMQQARTPIIDEINNSTKDLAQRLNSLDSKTELQTLQSAQQLMQENATRLSNGVQSSIRSGVTEIQENLSKRVFRIIGELDSDLSMTQLPAPPNVDWKSFVQVHTTVEEIERQEREYVSGSNDNAVVFGAGAGAMLGAALLGPLGFLAGAMMGGSLANEHHGRTLWKTVVEKVKKNKANGDKASQDLKRHLTQSVNAAFQRLTQNMSIEIDAVMHSKIESIEDQLQELEKAKSSSLQDDVYKNELKKVLIDIDKIQVVSR